MSLAFLLGGCSVAWQHNSVLVGQGTLHTTTWGTSHVLCCHEGLVLASYNSWGTFVSVWYVWREILQSDQLILTSKKIIVNWEFFHNFLTLWHLDIAFIMNILFVFTSWNANLDSCKSWFQDFFLQDAKNIYWGWGSQDGCKSWNARAVYLSLLLNNISFQAFLNLHSDICLYG